MRCGHTMITNPASCLAVAGSSCGLSISLITCPLSRVKILQQLTGVSFNSAVRLALRAARSIMHIPPRPCGEHSRTYMVWYAVLKQAPTSNGILPTCGFTTWARMFAGGGANVINFAVWYPLNTVLHVQQSVPNGTPVEQGRSQGWSIRHGYCLRTAVSRVCMRDSATRCYALGR